MPGRRSSTSSSTRQKGHPGTTESPHWFTSSYSNNGGNCIEVAHLETQVVIRDTKQAGVGPVLAMPAAAWAAFVGGLGRR
ncbi:DUF397 domain-containing protein [Streptomyces xiamenensis]|uniref:DUF397 domain-containing protein n=1 Tax=Streptomyces xiamenensis TaxID=408015 RepID=UPI0036E313E8